LKFDVKRSSLTSLERDRVPLARPIPVKEVPLVDRAEEMKLLKEAVDRTVQGEGGIVFLHGEAGIGKTRLARELRAYAHLQGMQVLYGRCPGLFRMDGVPPYVLWREVIRDYLENANLEQLYKVIGFYPAEVAKVAPEISQKLKAIPQSFPISPEQEQNRLFEAVSQLITNIAREAPLLVVLDDLQWTDPSSLLLFHYLARGLEKTPLLLLGAYRTADVDAKHPLTPILAELKRECLPQSVSLKRMSPEDTSEMIKQILDQDDIPTEFCQKVHEKTGGNPFFTAEVIESLKEEDVIHREEGRWKFKEISAIEFPETVKNVLKARLSRLDEECQNLLTLAAFVGNDFTCEALSGVSGIEENKLLDLIEKLLKTGLVKHRVIRGEDVCSFTDILVRDVLYEEVSPFRRKKIHNAVGTALEKVYVKKIDEHSGEIASHFLESRDKDKALDYLLKAGEKTQKIYANTEAASYYQSALKLIEEKEDELEKKGEILERLGNAKGTVGEYDTCVNCWNQALLLWEKLGEKEKVAKLHRKMSYVLYFCLGETEKAKEHQEAALKILEKEPESVELARLYANISQLSWHTGNVDKARSCAEKALELAERTQALEVVAEAYLNLGLVSATEANRNILYYEKALRIALDNSYIESALRAYNNLAVSLYTQEHDFQGSLECVEKGFELAKKVGVTSWISSMGEALAEHYLGMGNTSQALQLAEQSLAQARKIHDLANLTMSLWTLGDVYWVLGEWNKSEQLYLEASDFAKKTGRFQIIAGGYGKVGILLLHMKEEPARAKELLLKAYEVYEKAGDRWSKMHFSVNLIDSYIRLGEIDEANSGIEKLEKYAVEVNDTFLISWVHVLRARLCRVQKRLDESIEYFGKGLREWEALNPRQRDIYHFARFGLYEYAELYLERDHEGDSEKAYSLLSEALGMFQKMGAKKDIEKVEARIALIETGKVVSKPKPIEPVSTGYTDLDNLLCGGIPSNYAVVLTSPSCDERDLLIKDFLETGAKKGEITFFVTIDPSVAKPLAEKFQSNFYLFICNPEADAIIKVSPNVLTLRGVENLTDISIALTSAIQKLDSSRKGQRRICIGLASDVLLQHHAVETRRWLTALITKLKSKDFTTLAVMDPEMHPSQEVRAILDLFDGEISIFKKETEEGPGKYLKIQKMSNQKYLENELLLKKEDLQKRK
jgi:tetratricopeptide (TPR) repeat protein/KaiC/GvpD/RAD55 family RecA-like ATPase